MPFILFLFILLSTPAWSAPTCDSAANSVTEADPQTLSYTVGTTSTSNRVVLAMVAWRGEGTTVAGVTFDGAAMTQLGTGSIVTATNPDIGAAIYYSIGPSSGTFNISVDWNTTPTQGTVVGLTCYEVNQSTPFRGGTAVTSAVNGVASTSISVNSATGDLVIDLLSSSAVDAGAPTIGADQNALFANIVNGTTNHDTDGSSEAGAASVTMSWSAATNETWAQIGGSLMPPASSRRPHMPLIMP